MQLWHENICCSNEQALALLEADVVKEGTVAWILNCMSRSLGSGYISCDCLPGVNNYIPLSSALK